MTKQHSITLQQVKEWIHYDPETGIFTWLQGYFKIGRGSRAGHEVKRSPKHRYLQCNILKNQMLCHRLAWFYMTGQWPKDQIDHMDGNPFNNKFSNLREASHKQNQENKRPTHNSKTGHKGITLEPSNKWRAKIKHNFQTIYLGMFENLEDAIAARKSAEKIYFTHSPVCAPQPENLEQIVPACGIQFDAPSS